GAPDISSRSAASSSGTTLSSTRAKRCARVGWRCGRSEMTARLDDTVRLGNSWGIGKDNFRCTPAKFAILSNHILIDGPKLARARRPRPHPRDRTSVVSLLLRRINWEESRMHATLPRLGFVLALALFALASDGRAAGVKIPGGRQIEQVDF